MATERRDPLRFLAQLLVAAVVLVGAYFGATKLASMREIPEQVDVERAAPLVAVQAIERETATLWVRSQGTVVPALESDLVSDVAGRITFVSQELVVGGFFDEGELLVQIEARDFELRVTQAKAELARAELRLAEEEALAEVTL